MAMPPANPMQDKMQFTAGVGGVGGDIHRQWFSDERDSFISWIRGEFAAANAIIDSLCQHLRSIGDPGEYDMVFGCVQQRRYNWNPVLHMQQYFSVAEIIYALQQTTWRRQQRYYDNFKPAVKDMKKYNTQQGGFRQRQSLGTVKDAVNLGTECRNTYPPNENSFSFGKGEPETENCDQDGVKDTVKVNDNIIGVVDVKKETYSTNSKSVDGIGYCTVQEAKIEHNGCTSNSSDSFTALVENSSQPIPHQNGKQCILSTLKTFSGTEILDGKTVNVVDGLKLYEGFYDSFEVSRFLTIVNDLRAAGKKGQLQGQTFNASKRPAKGHGREFIQMGISIADAPTEDESIKGTFLDKKIQPIPAPLQEVIEKLLHTQVMVNKPDSCIVDFYNEGDYSQPHICPQWFGKPVCVLCLTECNMIFGRVILADRPGEYRGALKVSLLPGSLLVMDGKSADLARHAIPSLHNDCTMVTFTKSQPRRVVPPDTSGAAAVPSSWGHSPNRGPPKHYPAAAITTPVLPSPVFVVSPTVPGFHLPVALPPPRHLPLPGTGVFLPPPGSGASSPRPEDKAVVSEKENCLGEQGSAELKKPSAGKDAEEDQRDKPVLEVA